MSTENAPDVFQNVQAIQPQAVSTEAGNNMFKAIGEGVQAMGDNIIALLEAGLNKVTGVVMNGIGGLGSNDQAFSTGRYEDPGFAPEKPVIAAATPAMARGQTIEGPAISAPSRDIVSEAQLGQLTPNVNFSKGPSKEHGTYLS